MQTKVYFASSVPAALEVARHELGENALLVGSKPAPQAARQMGRLEVTFAWDPMEAPERKTEPAQMGNLGVETLVNAGFSRETAGTIAAGAARRSGNSHAAIVDEIASRIPVAAFVEMKPGESRTLAFIGPPGRGKTTSLFKIAMSFGLTRRVPVRIYCAGAPEQTARFAAILGTPFHPCESLAGLSLALNGESWKGIALIDTPGISLTDRDAQGELSRFFAAHREIEKHLVLRADASSADMLHMMSRFSGLSPARLLFTGMDEAVSMMPAIDALIRGGIPATFTGTGQRIPDDLEEADAGKLARNACAALTETKFAQAAA
jgi:flagellar biosynthesis protein FlhF